MDRRSFLKLGSLACATTTAPWLSACGRPRTPLNLSDSPDAEEFASWITDLAEDRIYTDVVSAMRNGLTENSILAGLFLATSRNVRPAPPFGFEYHCAFILHSILSTTTSLPDALQPYPLLYAVANYKLAQRTRGGFVLPDVSGRLPSPGDAVARFDQAMDAWDTEAADAAVTALFRAAPRSVLVDRLYWYGLRQGPTHWHDPIHPMQSVRALDLLGFHHGESVFRGLVYGLQDRGSMDATLEYQSNVPRIAMVPSTWAGGAPDAGATTSLLDAFRSATADGAGQLVLDALSGGVATSSIWEAIVLGCCELMIQTVRTTDGMGPLITGVHAVTHANACHAIFRSATRDETRMLALLQAASSIPSIRAENMRRGVTLDPQRHIDSLQPASGTAPTLDEIFAGLAIDRVPSVQQVLAFLASGSRSDFIDGVRRYVIQRGDEEHYYKLPVAIFEEAALASSDAGNRILASVACYLPSAARGDAPTYTSTQQALAST